MTASPTLISPTLATGISVGLGTASYMSPEQAAWPSCGQALRHLGVRMRAVRDAHRPADLRGGEVSDTLASILRDEPDWSLIPSTVSPTVRRYLQRCLAEGSEFSACTTLGTCISR